MHVVVCSVDILTASHCCRLHRCVTIEKGSRALVILIFKKEVVDVAVEPCFHLIFFLIAPSSGRCTVCTVHHGQIERTTASVHGSHDDVTPDLTRCRERLLPDWFCSDVARQVFEMCVVCEGEVEVPALRNEV